MPADLPAERIAGAQFAPTLPQLRQYSLTEKIRRAHSPQHGEKRATQIPNVSPAHSTIHPRAQRNACRRRDAL